MSDAQHAIQSEWQELRRLRDLMVAMGGLVENQLALAVQTLTCRDGAMAAAVIAQKRRADALEREAESFLARLLALHRPIVQDLRHIGATLKIVGDLERIADCAASIAARATAPSQFTRPPSLATLERMARRVQENLKLAIDAIGEADAEKAVRVCLADEAVDDLYTVAFRELITYMVGDLRFIAPCTQLLSIAKDLERAGDHVTNVAKAVADAATGEELADSSAFAVARASR